MSCSPPLLNAGKRIYTKCSGIKKSYVYLTGVKALRSGLVISSSVDQRLALWELAKEDQVFTDFFLSRVIVLEQFCGIFLCQSNCQWY